MAFSELKVGRKTVLGDAFSGLVLAIIAIPNDLANGLLAGTNPVYGLYSLIGGSVVAALFTSSYIMNVDATSASALATANVLAGVPPEQHLRYLVTLCLLVGIFQLALGLLGLGSLTSFISNAVMTGFLTGIALLTIAGQAGDLTGYASPMPGKLGRLVDTLLHPAQIDLPTLAVGLTTIAVIALVGRTPFERYSYPLALVVATLMVPLLRLESVALVGDTTQLPTSLLSVHLPDVTLLSTLAGPALAIAIITLVQASGVSSSMPNRDGSYPDPSGDFRGQGAANIAVGLLGGLPVGGSLSGTILVRKCGGQSRWANIFTGLLAIPVLLLLASLIVRLPMASLAGMLVMVGIEMLSPRRILLTIRTRGVSAAVMTLTLVATLLLPIQTAVAIGVVMHFIVYIYQSAREVRVAGLRVVDGDKVEAIGPATASLPSNAVTILYPVGNLFFAGAAQFEAQLPEVRGSRHAVVLIDLRDRDELGSTFVRVLSRYARELREHDGRLMLVAVTDRVREQLRLTQLQDVIGPENIFGEQQRLGAALFEALAAAAQWLRAQTASEPITAAAAPDPHGG